MNKSKRSAVTAFLAVTVVLLGAMPSAAQVPADQAADMLLGAARRAYNEKNYPFAAERFREFLKKYGGHKEANAARYGLALCLIDGPKKDYNGALQQLSPLAGNKNLPQHPFVLYYLGLAQRGLGVQELAQAEAKPNEAKQHRDKARPRFEEASKHFAAALTEFTARIPKTDEAPKQTPIEMEWAARARCDYAEMLLRLHKAKEARSIAEPFAKAAALRNGRYQGLQSFLKNAALAKSRYQGLGLYYHGFACFLLKDNFAAGRSLNLLTPFNDPVYGTHARYLLARVHHAAGERPEALTHYKGVLADHDKRKKEATEALKHPENFKNDPQVKTRLEKLVRGPLPDHVARATFFLGVMQYEDGQFADAVKQLSAFHKEFPKSPLASEAALRLGFCQVQLRQFAEAQKTLQPLADKEPRLADQALLWIGKAQAGAADPANRAAHDQALKTALATYGKAADKANQLVNSDPNAKARRGEILLVIADTQQSAKQYKEAAATYNRILNEKLLAEREEEVLQHLADALHLVGDYKKSDEICLRFRNTHPQSVLLAAVLFRRAENAYFQGVAAEKLPNPADRKRESERWNKESMNRYRVIVEKYPEFAQVNLARYGLGLSYYHKGDLDKAKEILEAIPAAERNGDLAVVPYQLADILIRQAPAKADDALAAGMLEEQLKKAIELLDGFIAAQPKGAQTADALFKLGHCRQRMAALLAQPADKQKTLTAARTTYDQLLQRFPKDSLVPNAVFERAKVRAAAKDIGGAVGELRRFLNDPLKKAAVAPMALLRLATLMRKQNKAAEAVKVLAQCRQQHEQELLKDPARAAWVPLLQYHHGIALREAGKRGEARQILDQLVRQAAGRPEAADAALRAGQCLKDDGQQKITEAKKRLAQTKAKSPEHVAAQKSLDEGVADVRDAVKNFLAQAEQLRQKKPESEVRARLLYEAAWGSRILAELEIESTRRKIRDDLWQKMKDEVAKKTPTGHQPPYVAAPDVPLKSVPLQPAEKDVRKHYQTLIEAFPDLTVNADALFELAELLSQRGEHDAAIKQLKEAIDKEPSPQLTDKIRLRLGDCLLRKGDIKAALAEFEPIAANTKSVECAQAKYRAGECHLQAGNFAEAVKQLTPFRDQGPFQNIGGLSDRALLRLGYALGQLKQWDASRQAYEQVVNRFGNGPWGNEGRYGVGWAYQNKGQYDNAVNTYNQVVSRVVTEVGARAQMNIGLCRLAQKRYAEAANALLVVPFTYDYPHLSALSLVAAAHAFAENKQTEQAVKLLKRVLRDHADSESADVARKRLEELKKL